MSKVIQVFSYVVFYKFFLLCFIFVCNPFWISIIEGSMVCFWIPFFFFLHNMQLFQHHLLKRLSFLHCFDLDPLLKINWLYLWESTSGISTLFHWSVYLIFLAVSQCLSYYSFLVTPEVGYCQSFNFIFLFQHSTGYSESFTLPYQLQNQCVDIYKITC